MAIQSHSISWRILLGMTFTVFVFLFFIPRIPQDPQYHLFADQRTMLGIPHFMDVISNLPFFLVGFLGFAELRRQRAGGHLRKAEEILPYFYFMVGVFLAGFGSGFYHWAPDDARLVWDRIPITLVVTSLVSIVFSEKAGNRSGLWFLVFLVPLGIASVVYWKWTGDLRFYGFIQFYPALLVPLVLYLFPKPYPAARQLLGLALCYGLAKFFEWQDAAFFSLTGGLISGHTVKHLLAALGLFWIVRMFQKRRLS